MTMQTTVEKVPAGSGFPGVLQVPAATCLEQSGEIAVSDASVWRLDVTYDVSQLQQDNPIAGLIEELSQLPGITPNLLKLETVLGELFNNALEHGLLGLSSLDKQTAEGFLAYYHLRQVRLKNLHKGYIRVHVACFSQSHERVLVITMEDSGRGFDNGSQPGVPGPNKHCAYGRGLQLVTALADSVRFFGNGNRVVVRFSWKTLH